MKTLTPTHNGRQVLARCAIALIAGSIAAVAEAQAPAQPATTAPVQDLSAYILTPAAPATPRINGPRLQGVRVGNPVLYAIPTTGDRPMTFSADGLPAGLKLDANTGHITGALPTAGEYKVMLHARNGAGAAETEFTFVAGDKIALTPALGWNSYNAYATGIDQDKTLRAARAMVSSGLANHGWTYINMDEGWQGQRGGEFNGVQADPRKFSDFTGMISEIHGMGLKIGLYSTPWVKGYGGFIGGTAENPEGKEQRWEGNAPKNIKVLPFAIGKFSFATNDVKQWVAWGIDYLKYDWGPVEPPEAKEMSDLLRASGRDIVYSVSNNHVKNIVKVIDDLAPLVNSWRTTTDIVDNWGRVQEIGFNNEAWNPYIKPGQYTDADMLVVGWVGWGKKLHYTRLTPAQQYTHITLWSMLSSPLILGCDLEKLDPFTISLLSNDEVLAVNQDAAVKPAKRVSKQGDIEILSKELEDGSHAIGLFNRGGAKADVTVKWSDLGLERVGVVRDLWRQKDLADASEKVTVPVDQHGCVLLKVTSKQ